MALKAKKANAATSAFNGVGIARIVAINPTTEELKKFGFTPKNEEQNYSPLRRAYVKYGENKNEYITTPKAAERFAENFERSTGKVVMNDQIISEELVQLTAARVVVIFKINGKYAKQTFEWVNDEDYVPMVKDGQEKLMTPTGYTSVWEGEKVVKFDRATKSTFLVDASNKNEFIYKAPGDVAFTRDGNLGSGNLSDFINLLYSYCHSTVDVFDEDDNNIATKGMDFLSYIGGNNLIEGDVSDAQELIDLIHSYKEGDKAGVFVLQGVYFNRKRDKTFELDKPYNRIAHYYRGVKYTSNNKPNYPTIVQKVLNGYNVAKLGIFVATPVNCPAAMLTPEMLSSIVAKLDNEGSNASLRNSKKENDVFGDPDDVDGEF